ncbi:hypothetical protein SUGI_0574700 [Cryptomeria japonica]|nr:hypothetical protein SUGI_0574700 [Cryptomeria japonica]
MDVSERNGGNQNSVNVVSTEISLLLYYWAMGRHTKAHPATKEEKEKFTGGTSAWSKANEVARAGGVGTIVANEVLLGAEQRITDLNSQSSNVPSMTVSFSMGTLVPTVAVFSSRGPSGGYPFILKPDMIAPGVNILAAVRNDYDFKSGTSMATPHVTGIAALIKVLHPMWSPAATKSALMTSSYIVDNTNQPIADLSTVLEADPFATGAGHIDPEAAVDPGLVYDMEAQDYINFLCFLNYTKQQIALLSNASCPSSTLAVIDLNYPSFTMLLKSDSQSVEVDYSIGYRRNSKAASPMADDRPDRQRRIHRISA